MLLRFLTARSARSTGVLLGFSLLVPAETVTADLLDLVIPALLAGKQWIPPQRITSTTAGDASLAHVAVDATGNALAVWEQVDGRSTNIWANRYTAGSGWGTAQLIEHDNTGAALTPQVAVDGAGNACAVWAQSDGVRTNIWANRFAALGGSWGTAQLLETDNAGPALAPQIALDSAGNALAVWAQSDGVRTNIWANRSAAGKSWGTAQRIETDDAGNAWSPQLVVDSAGNAMAAWYQYDGSVWNIWANRYTAGAGWQGAKLLETDNAGMGALSCRLAVDGAGNVLAVWHQSDGIRTSIWANRYTVGGTWGSAKRITSTAAGDAWYPQLAVTRTGNALVLWQQYDGKQYSIWANSFTAATGWQGATLLETDKVGALFPPQLAVDPTGNALAVWQQSDGTRWNIKAKHSTGASWPASQLIETNNAGNAQSPQLVGDGAGNALAVWQQWDGSRSTLWAAWYH